MASEPGSVGQQRREPLHPPVDRDVIDLDAAFDQQFLHVPVRQAVAQVPAHCQHDHLSRKATRRKLTEEVTSNQTQPRTSPVNPA